MSSLLSSLPDWARDNDLVESATASLQAHEQLCFQMKSKLKTKNEKGIRLSTGRHPLTHTYHPLTHTYHIHTHTAVSECITILDQLRQLKSKIEGTYFNFQPIELNRDKLVELKHLVVAYTPATLQKPTKEKIANALAELFHGQVKKVVYACILTCPWFASVQSEVSAQAKNNLLFVVFVSSDEQFFSLATPHEKELSETIDAEVSPTHLFICQCLI